MGAAAHDVENTFNDIKESDVVQDLGEAAMEWGQSEEVEDLKALDEEFKKSPEGQALIKEWMEFGELLKEAVEPTENGFHIHNSKFDALEDQLDDIKEDYDDLEGSKWDDAYHAAFKAAFSSKKAHALGEALENFKESDEGEELHDEVEDFFETVHDNVEVSDVPEKWMDELEDASEEVEEIADDMDDLMLF